MSRGFVLDTGALIAMDKRSGQQRLAGILHGIRRDGRLVISAGSIAEAWRGSPRQVPLALLLRRPDTEVSEITTAAAKAIGAFLGYQPDGHDIVDAHVVMLARHHELGVITSDPDDLRALDPGLAMMRI